MNSNRSHSPAERNRPGALTGQSAQTERPAKRDDGEELSSEELVQVLVRSGANIVATQGHGVLLAAHRRLIFLRHAKAVGRAELCDALRVAEVGPGRFDRLLALVRGETLLDPVSPS